jgi:tetratricopeptide (TPR) repeat protein
MNVDNPLIAYWLSDKNNRPLFIEMINEVMSAQDYDLALNLINQSPVSLIEDSQFIKVDILLAMQSLEEASTALAQISPATINQQRYNYYISKLALLQGQLDKALKHLEKNVTNLNKDGFLLKARAEYLSGAISTAARTLHNLGEIDHNAEALGLSAMVALDLGAYSDADKFSARALALNPQQPDALLAHASFLLHQQNGLDANICIQQFLAHMPTSGRAWSIKGQSSLLLQNYNKSLEEFNTAVQFMPEHVGTWHLLAWNYYLLGLLNNAEQAFNSALQLDDAFADSYGGLAVIAAANGQVEVAQRHIKLASRLSRSCFSAEYAKALLESASCENDVATKRIENLLTQYSHLDNITYHELIRKAIESRINE